MTDFSPVPPAQTPPGPAPEPLAPALAAGPVQALRAVSVLLLLALMALGLAWELWLAPTGNKTLVIKVLPLLLPLAGLLRHRLYTYRWLSLMLWLYVTEGLVRANGLDSGWSTGLAWGQVALCALLFVCCVVYVRLRLKAGKAATTASAAPAPSAPG
ncbi:DUF2069 domain-containing protein [Aquabacterium sp. OR-4]|nr:DUF2069 domain-containing protein [Aquabacterium sp. OR-4]MDT7835977.1 DUF2069 domain-containing protein [Aquabacterium sp. OR-4]